MGQDNSRRKQVLIDLKSALVALGLFQDVTFTITGPEQVIKFPVAFVVAGGGAREPRDIKYFHFVHNMECEIYLVCQEQIPGNLFLELEDLIKSVVDKIDDDSQTLQDSQAYDMFVSNIETDRGTVAAGGARIAIAVITVTAILPPRDE